ncbi:tetratricopeptide repeat protein [Chloroflexi bacterium TSY]|nr:tetratricopeptide repeat protein [Chloroflexi bacterium TSY]
MDSSNYTYDVFISYSHTNKEWVEGWFLSHLEATGLRVCINFRDFDIGVPRLVNMERAVEQSRKTLLVLTPHWVESEWTNFEALSIQTKDPIGLRRRMLPMMLEPCQPPGRVSIFTHADFTQADRQEEQLQRVINAINDKVSLSREIPATSATRQPAETAANNLPIQLTSFVGRQRERDELKQLFSTYRLVTLSGAPGTGKTRLGLQVAEELQDDFADGAFLISLAPIGDPNLVTATIAKTLGVREMSNQSLLESLQAYLRDKQMLLVLDNFEQVIAAASLVTDLLTTCSQLKVMVTSREVLQLRGECSYFVSPLELPHLNQLPPVEFLTQNAAIDLFVQRAQAIRPDFVLNDANVPTVTKICVQLDGLPLAIELAAARIKLLSPETMLARLRDRFKLLSSGARDLPNRQRALKAAIDWSYELLDEEEKKLFRRLAVFIGGRTLEAVEAICKATEISDNIAPLQIDVLDGLTSLVNKNLVQQEAGVDGEFRFTMLATIHQYATEQLEEYGEIEALQHLHAEYFLALAEEAEPELVGPKQATWLDRVEVENDNLRTALCWFKESGKIETGLRLGGVLYRFWERRGYLTEGRMRLTELLALADNLGDTATRAKSLNGVGVLSTAQGDYKAARILHEESLAIYQKQKDDPGIAISLNNLGNVACYQGDYKAARILHEESLAIKRELKDDWGIAISLNNLGAIAQNQDDYETALFRYEESLAIRRTLRDKQGISSSLNNIALVMRYKGNYKRARALHEESLAIDRELGDKRGIAMSLNGLGIVAYETGDYETALSHYEESLAIKWELGDKQGIATSLENFVELAIVQDQPERALCLASAAVALREVIGGSLSPNEQAKFEGHVETARLALGEVVATQALAAGRAMTLEQAIAYTLREDRAGDDAKST